MKKIILIFTLLILVSFANAIDEIPIDDNFFQDLAEEDPSQLTPEQVADYFEYIPPEKYGLIEDFSLIPAAKIQTVSNQDMRFLLQHPSFHRLRDLEEEQLVNNFDVVSNRLDELDENALNNAIKRQFKKDLKLKPSKGAVLENNGELRVDPKGSIISSIEKYPNDCVFRTNTDGSIEVLLPDNNQKTILPNVPKIEGVDQEVVYATPEKEGVFFNFELENGIGLHNGGLIFTNDAVFNFPNTLMGYKDSQIELRKVSTIFFKQEIDDEVLDEMVNIGESYVLIEERGYNFGGDGIIAEIYDPVSFVTLDTTMGGNIEVNFADAKINSYNSGLFGTGYVPLYLTNKQKDGSEQALQGSGMTYCSLACMDGDEEPKEYLMTSGHIYDDLEYAYPLSERDREFAEEGFKEKFTDTLLDIEGSEVYTIGVIDPEYNPEIAEIYNYDEATIVNDPYTQCIAVIIKTLQDEVDLYGMYNDFVNEGCKGSQTAACMDIDVRVGTGLGRSTYAALAKAVDDTRKLFGENPREQPLKINGEPNPLTVGRMTAWDRVFEHYGLSEPYEEGKTEAKVGDIIFVQTSGTDYGYDHTLIVTQTDEKGNILEIGGASGSAGNKFIVESWNNKLYRRFYNEEEPIKRILHLPPFGSKYRMSSGKRIIPKERLIEEPISEEEPEYIAMDNDY